MKLRLRCCFRLIAAMGVVTAQLVLLEIAPPLHLPFNAATVGVLQAVSEHRSAPQALAKAGCHLLQLLSLL